MEPDLQSQTDLLHHAAEGTVLEVAPDCYLVRGRTSTYEVNWREETCDCPNFRHRLKGYGTCKHLQAVKQWTERGEKTCPCCRGEGCPGCEGVGRVSSELFPVLLDIQKAEDDARLAYIKELFR